MMPTCEIAHRKSGHQGLKISLMQTGEETGRPGGGKLLPQGRRKKLRFSLPPTILCSCLGHMVRSSKYSNTRQKYNQPLISSIELSICQEWRQPGSFFTTQKNEELNCLPADATSLLREHCGLSSQFQK